ncbi:MAG TPA: DUF2169 domain-containing protein [Polyangiaceae bacterium]|nr:DUF2169 domain-containing protein [Polyangiaceae bacterium]
MPMEIAALAPLAVGTLAWRDAAGVLQLTVIAKGTFEIRPDHRARPVDPYPLFGDVYFEENEGRSLRVASDYVPRKPKVDVLFTGAAYAPVGERVTHRSIRLAMAVAGKTIFDKKLLAVGSRERDKSGTPTPPQPFVYLPLRWELAYGGAASRANPVGVGEDPGDPRLPSIVDPNNPKRAAGLGPVPPSWIARQEALGGADAAGLAGPVPTLRAGMDAYFNSAPPDQQLATLRGDESVLMSGLHPGLAEVTWRLPGVRAHAALDVNGSRRVVALEPDTVWIEGEMLRCAITWRGAVTLDAAEAAGLDSARLLATLAKLDAAPSWERRTAVKPQGPALVGATAPAPEGASLFQRSASIELEIEHSMVFAPKSQGKAPAPPKRVTANVPIVNETGLHAWTLPWQVKPPESAIVVIVKATYVLGDDGTLSLAPEQDPPSGDVPHEEEGPSTLRYASDFAVFKPAADVMLVGHAYPSDATVGVSNVEIRLGNLRRRVAVFGDRSWGGFGFEGKPSRFDKMPLRWERALGGPLSEANPVGRGFKTGVLVPNLERPEALLKSRDDRPAPACFAPVDPSWPARKSRTGTYDAAWLKERWPYLPADFDWGHFNAAPPEQQVPYLRGDERFAVIGVRPGGKGVEGQLPGARPRVFAQRTEEVGGDFFEVLLRLDTAWFDTDANKVVLVWRGLYSSPDDDSPDIAALYVDVEHGEAVRSVEQARERFLAVVATAAALPVAAMAFPGEPKQGSRPLAPLPGSPEPPRAEEVLAKLSAGASLAHADLTRIDLNGADLTGADLTGAILAHANLTGATLDRAKLAGAVLVGARADRASFAGADLRGADLTGAQLARAVLQKANLARAILDGVRAGGATLTDVQAERASLVGAGLVDAKLDRAKLAGADLTGADLTGASLREATLDDVRLYDVRGDGAAFDKAAMPRARADRASLRRASFAGIDAPQSVWEAADLTGASFLDAKVPHALFQRAKLDEVSLTRAVASEASFRRASLKRARCTRANLMKASFERADLTEADLRGANLFQAETWRAKTGHVDLTAANVTGTKLAGRRS